TSATVAASAPASRQRRSPRARATRSLSARACSSSRARRPGGGGTACAAASASSAASSSARSSTPMLTSSGTRLLSGEPRPQAEHAFANPRLHRTERHSLTHRDLAVRQPFEIGDLECPPLLARQRGERGAQAIRLLLPVYGVVRPVGCSRHA